MVIKDSHDQTLLLLRCVYEVLYKILLFFIYIASSLNLDLPDFKQLENSQSVGNPSCSSFSVHSHSSATTSDHIKPKESGQSLVSQNSSTTSIGVAINEVANAQKDMGNTNDVGGNALGKKHNASSLNSRSKIWGGNNPTDLLSTISEKQEEEDSRAVTSFSQAIVISPEVKDSRSTMPTTKSSTSLKRQNKLREVSRFVIQFLPST